MSQPFLQTQTSFTSVRTEMSLSFIGDHGRSKCRPRGQDIPADTMLSHIKCISEGWLSMLHKCLTGTQLSRLLIDRGSDSPSEVPLKSPKQK